MDLTPLIDVVFLLLIFFMVSTTFEREGLMRLVLPAADATDSAALPAHLEIVIDAQGRYLIDGQSLAMDEIPALRAALAASMSGMDAPQLVIRADGRAPHQSVVTAMEAAGALGLSRVSIATTRPLQP